jgi:hypothetical protein
MFRDEINYKNDVFIRVNKTKAKNIFNSSCAVLLLPSNIRPNNMWIGFHRLNNQDDFEKQVSNYIYYNCNEETGLYPKYYIKK